MKEYRARLRAARAAAAADARADDAPTGGGRCYRAEDLEAAFGAGRAFRVFEEVAAGVGDVEELAGWVRSGPPCLDLFLRHVAASPWPEVWQRLRREHLA